jgi:hypothetical protein
MGKRNTAAFIHTYKTSTMTNQLHCLRLPAQLNNPTATAPVHSIYQSFTEASIAQEKHFNETGEVLGITTYGEANKQSLTSCVQVNAAGALAASKRFSI